MKGYNIFCYGFLMVESPNNDLVDFINAKEENSIKNLIQRGKYKS